MTTRLPILQLLADASATNRTELLAALSVMGAVVAALYKTVVDKHKEQTTAADLLRKEQIAAADKLRTEAAVDKKALLDRWEKCEEKHEEATEKQTELAIEVARLQTELSITSKLESLTDLHKEMLERVAGKGVVEGS